MPHNVQLWLEQCNDREAPLETSALAKGKRMAVDLNRKQAEPKRKGSFRKPPAGYVSPLSKEGRARMKERMK